MSDWSHTRDDWYHLIQEPDPIFYLGKGSSYSSLIDDYELTFVAIGSLVAVFVRDKYAGIWFVGNNHVL